jgi:hypothetical protein
MALNDIVLSAEVAPAPPAEVPEFGGSPIGALIAALGWLAARKKI